MKRKLLPWSVLALLLALLTGIWIGPSYPARAILEPHLGYGINVRNASSIDPLVSPMGFDWVKLWEEYSPVPTERLPYDVLFLISCGDFSDDQDLGAWGDHVQAIATSGLGLVEAYEICNEPNLSHFWLGHPPDPSRYAEMLCVAYDRIKAVDPEATVVSAGLAPVGRIQGQCGGWNRNNCGAMDERAFASAVLAHGASECMNAFGYHPYGFVYEPEQDAAAVSNGFAFRGAEIMHQILVQHGIDYIPIWATEFNWLRDWTEDGGLPHHCIDYYETWFGWMQVTGAQQADYLVRAFEYADENWPWMHAMFVWNLDWHDYHTWDCEAARYFSIRRDNGTSLGLPTLAYSSLISMTKRPGPFAPRLHIAPQSLLLLADVDESGVMVSGVRVRNAGYRTLDWTAAADLAGDIVPTLPVTTGTQGEPISLLLDTTGLVTGTYLGAITVTATASDVQNSPLYVGIEVRVIPEVWHAFLPLTQRNW